MRRRLGELENEQPPAPSWGSMLNAAQRVLVNAPWMAILSGLAIFLTVLSFNLGGDGLRDAPVAVIARFTTRLRRRHPPSP